MKLWNLKILKLDKIIEAGRIAPTAKNIQPVKIFVIQSKDGLNKIDKASPCRYGSQTVLLVCGDVDEAFSKDDHSTYVIDSCIIATHMILEATNIGIYGRIFTFPYYRIYNFSNHKCRLIVYYIHNVD